MTVWSLVTVLFSAAVHYRRSDHMHCTLNSQSTCSRSRVYYEMAMADVRLEAGERRLRLVRAVRMDGWQLIDEWTASSERPAYRHTGLPHYTTIRCHLSRRTGSLFDFAPSHIAPTQHMPHCTHRCNLTHHSTRPQLPSSLFLVCQQLILCSAARSH